MDEARPEYLNVTELYALITDPEFSQKYDLITEESFSGLADKVLDSGEAADRPDLCFGASLDTETGAGCNNDRRD